MTKKFKRFFDYSHPSVGGVMLKDFWDGHATTADTALFEGSELTVSGFILILFTCKTLSLV